RTFSASLLFSCAALHHDLHSFPTRRSSDLRRSPPPPASLFCASFSLSFPACSSSTSSMGSNARNEADDGADDEPPSATLLLRWRSEEHTSELQSRENLVCRLLLEKKKIQWI